MSIRQRLYLLLLTALIGAAAVFAVTAGGSAVSDRYARLQAAALEVRTELLEARRHEKNFFERKEDQYVDKVETHVRAARTALGTINELDDEVDASRTQATDLLDHYLSRFKAAAAGVKSLGYDDRQGQEAVIIKAAVRLEALAAEAGSDALQVLVLTMRRHEKNYQLRGEARYLDLVRQAAGKAQATAGSSLAGLPAALDGYLAALDGYARTFEAAQADKTALIEAARQVEPTR